MKVQLNIRIATLILQLIKLILHSILGKTKRGGVRVIIKIVHHVMKVIVDIQVKRGGEDQSTVKATKV